MALHSDSDSDTRCAWQDSANYRQRTQECRQHADKSTCAEDKAAWLRMAEDWQKLAQGLDERGTAGLKLFQWAPPGPPQRPFGYRNATPSHAPFGGCRKAGALEPGHFIPPEGGLGRAKTIRD